MKKVTFFLFLSVQLSLYGCSEKTTKGPAPIRISTLKKTFIAVNDTHIKYFGRWDFSNPDQYISYWGGAYFKVKFTGTSVGIKVGNKTNYYAKIDDGPWISYKEVEGEINLTPTPLKKGIHSLSVAQGKDYNYVFNFQKLILDKGAKIQDPESNKSLIEYIGDSITSGYTDPQANVSDYAWVCSEALEAEHTQIAYPGINLISGYKTRGMDQQYFKARSTAYPDAMDWNFTRYTPNVVVINLGTNDTNNHVPQDVFKGGYVNFLSNLRAKFPKAEIFVMRTFSGAMAMPTKDAVKQRISDGDQHIHYVDTSDWLVRTSDDFTDHTHPSVNGHKKVTNFLKPLLAPYLSH